jgi:hypothetical protein
MKKSVLLIAIFSTLLFASFSRSGNIVTDHSTGLMWEDQSSIKKQIGKMLLIIAKI